MAADYSGNPIRMDTAADAVSNVWVQALYWVNDPDAPLANDDDLVIVFNGTVLKYQTGSNILYLTDARAASVGPFSNPVYCETLTITTIDGGAVHVWLATHPPESITP
jgi:hypothetical protein